MDMMDAVNISLSSDESAPADQRVAVWYIFPHDKVDVLRKFLDDEYRDDSTVTEGDIIHSGSVVLDDDMLKNLVQKTRLEPWTIFQRPGDTVFIPAYCPHMVCWFHALLRRLPLSLIDQLGPEPGMDNQDRH